MLRLEWSDFKAFTNDRQVPIHENKNDGIFLYLEAFDGPISRSCKLKIDNTTGTDYKDYIDNYQTSANQSMTDSNGITLSRTKITKTGWHFQLHGLEFISSKLASIYNKDITGTDLGFTTIKYYDSQGAELVAGTQAELDSDCVETVIDWEMDQDVEVLGGVLEQSIPPDSDVRIWICAIPDLTVAQGGSIPFIDGGINLRYLSQNLDIDGKTPKLLPYNAVYHTNKFRLVVKHGAGVQCPINILFKLFKENS